VTEATEYILENGKDMDRWYDMPTFEGEDEGARLKGRGLERRDGGMESQCVGVKGMQIALRFSLVTSILRNIQHIFNTSRQAERR
jgi:hypothetical protein